MPGVREVEVALGVMSDEQRSALRDLLKGGQPDREIPFARPDSLTTVIAVASGKGGVGKSSVTVNLALALAAQGRTVGVLDADIYGHSVPAMLGVADHRPTAVEDMIMPVPAHGLKVISIGMLKPRRDQVVAWRGPILDRALTQMLADVYWGDLDFLLLDLPPGTGDVAISLGQKLPSAQVLVVTTPQAAAAEVAERAGTMASMLNQRVIGVVENMSYLVVTCPHCGQQTGDISLRRGIRTCPVARRRPRVRLPAGPQGAARPPASGLGDGESRCQHGPGTAAPPRRSRSWPAPWPAAARPRGRPAGPDPRLPNPLPLCPRREELGSCGFGVVRGRRRARLASTIHRSPGLVSFAPSIAAATSEVVPVTLPRMSPRMSVISVFTSAMIGSTSSSKCFWTKARGFRSRRSRSSKPGPSSRLSCCCAEPAMVRT